MTTKYTEDHEYVRTGDGSAVIGISNYAQEQLGDIVFVELPETGKTFKKGEEIAVVESVKAASEIYAPVSGTVSEVNSELQGDPGLINTDPMDKGWLVKIKLDDENELEALMDETAYAKHTD